MNMRSRILALCGLCAVSLTALAQDYKYGAIYDAVGNIKEIKTNSMLKLTQKKVKINKNGMSGLSIMLYDSKGLPVGWEMNMIGKQNFQKFFWNENNRLDSVAVKIDAIGNSELITAKNQYSGDTMSAQCIEVQTKHGTEKFIRTFDEYVFDDKGNWISRKVNQTEIDRDSRKSESEFTETREIKYYE